jgi:hypothetical protein
MINDMIETLYSFGRASFDLTPITLHHVATTRCACVHPSYVLRCDTKDKLKHGTSLVARVEVCLQNPSSHAPALLPYAHILLRTTMEHPH